MTAMHEDAPLLQGSHRQVPQENGNDSDSKFLRAPVNLGDATMPGLLTRRRPPMPMETATKLVSEGRLQPPKQDWKLFSPSTWKFLRNTAWGRKKAKQRHTKQVAKSWRAFVEDGVRARTAAGTPYRGTNAAPDDPGFEDNPYDDWRATAAPAAQEAAGTTPQPQDQDADGADPDRAPGDMIDGHAMLHQPGRDPQDKGMGIPSIVRDIFKLPSEEKA